MITDDLQTHCPAFAVSTIFDVGANIGQSAVEYAISYPMATIYAFEPASVAYKQLVINSNSYPNIKCINAALGSRRKRGSMYALQASTGNSIATISERVARMLGRRRFHVKESFKMLKGDDYARDANISYIDLLKVDTEGYDLHVLNGFAKMIQKQEICVIQIEVGFHSRKHLGLNKVIRWMNKRNYSLFGIYNQHLNKQLPTLRRADAIFMSNDCCHALRDNESTSFRYLR